MITSVLFQAMKARKFDRRIHNSPRHVNVLKSLSAKGLGLDFCHHAFLPTCGD